MSRIVCSADLFREHFERMETAGHAVVRVPLGDANALADAARSSDAVICLLNDDIGSEILEGSERLKIVANVAVGYENIDVATAQRCGIVVTNTPDVLTEATADHTFALLLATARNIAEADADIRNGEFSPWRLQQPFLGTAVHGRTLGIVGPGRIGGAVARRGRFGFGMRILVHSRTARPNLERELGAARVPFETLLAESDFVSVHVPLTAATHHLFGAVAFERMKPTAILINVARGPVVDEAALAEALETGAIAGAGLDVFEREPAVHPGLVRCRNAVLTPHLGSATVDTRRAMADIAVDNVLAVLAGSLPKTPVTGNSRAGSG
jgi:glyoxylate reductase